MKRLLLLLPLLLTPAAQAVDYVKCEAMNKAYGRLMKRAGEAKREAVQAVKEEVCGNKYQAQVAQSQGDSTLIDRYYTCAANLSLDASGATAAGEAAMAEVQIRIDKVKADYEAEGCF